MGNKFLIRVTSRKNDYCFSVTPIIVKNVFKNGYSSFRYINASYVNKEKSEMMFDTEMQAIVRAKELIIEQLQKEIKEHKESEKM